MHLKYMLETMELEDKIVVVPVGEDADEFRGIMKVNEVGATILDLLKQDISENEIVNHLYDEYDISKELLAKEVNEFVETLNEKGLLV